MIPLFGAFLHCQFPANCLLDADKSFSAIWVYSRARHQENAHRPLQCYRSVTVRSPYAQIQRARLKTAWFLFRSIWDDLEPFFEGSLASLDRNPVVSHPAVVKLIGSSGWAIVCMDVGQNQQAVRLASSVVNAAKLLAMTPSKNWFWIGSSVAMAYKVLLYLSSEQSLRDPQPNPLTAGTAPSLGPNLFPLPALDFPGLIAQALDLITQWSNHFPVFSHFVKITPKLHSIWLQQQQHKLQAFPKPKYTPVPPFSAVFQHPVPPMVNPNPVQVSVPSTLLSSSIEFPLTPMTAPTHLTALYEATTEALRRDDSPSLSEDPVTPFSWSDAAASMGIVFDEDTGMFLDPEFKFT